MPPFINTPVYFGNFLVTPQVKQYRQEMAKIAKPNLMKFEGHVLVSPRRAAQRLSDLNHAEVTDLFLTVQQVGRMVERFYGASSLNIAIQDGPAAGQSVPHLHTHIIPRQSADLDGQGGSDAIYGMLEGDEGDVGKHQWEKSNRRPKFPTVDDSSRKPRGEEEMAEEAQKLAHEMTQQQLHDKASQSSL